MEINSPQAGKRLAFPPIWMGPWPVDPHAPRYGGIIFWSHGPFISYDKTWPDEPTQLRRFPTDPSAPKGKKPVFIPLPEKMPTWEYRLNALPEPNFDSARGPIFKLSEEEIKEFVGEVPKHPEPSTPDDVPSDLFTNNPGSVLDFNPFGPGWQDRADRIFAAIEQQINEDDMSKKTKKQRIESLELKVEMLRDQLQDFITASNNIHPHLGISFQQFPADVRPAEGVVHYGKYDTQRCLAWIAAGKWRIQVPNFSIEIVVDLNKLVWYKNISPSDK